MLGRTSCSEHQMHRACKVFLFYIITDIDRDLRNKAVEEVTIVSKFVTGQQSNGLDCVSNKQIRHKSCLAPMEIS